MSMPPHMRGYPAAAQNNNVRYAVAGQDAQRQQQQQKQDEQIAQMLQAQEFHRTQNPSHIAMPHHSGAHHGGGGRHGGKQDAIQAMIGGAGHNGGGSHDPEREARHRVRDEQLKMALEVNPEAFISVPMLYVSCTLNDVPLKAFVDTGAQMTVMTAKCAQKCHLLEKVDPRFRGVAAGVGAARIAGRVHMATLRFGSTTAVDVSITVLEQNHGPELLVGLDLMRKYQAVVDLARNVMLIGGKAIPFVEDDDHKRREQRR